eukprot:CAMPEP_0194345622 /NCGR_PEP_ID=MMETSP0171-20130528/104963_1 /TAXON_ID=218684 /ORGANISM="Corethron pennatum, Strain L29A3" /LENGTH=583 /DNA_ID=CAMNT_0039112639 /DNA_START=77 /DNA_END=1825 /DNA_ORIENTATION=+
MVKVKLSLHAEKLKNTSGIFGVSDPFATVSLLSLPGRNRPLELGRTEVIQNNLSPDWVVSFVFDYEPGEEMNFVVTVYDQTSKGGENLKKHKEMGHAKFDTEHVLRSPGNLRSASLGGGTLYVTVEPYDRTAGILFLELRGIDLPNVERTILTSIDKSDPFVELSARKLHPNGTIWDVVYRSERVDNDLNPWWERASVSVSALCQGNLMQPVKISVYDYNRGGDHKLMGWVDTSLDGILAAAAQGNRFKLENNYKKGEIEVVRAVLGTSVGLVGLVAGMHIEAPHTSVPEPARTIGAASDAGAADRSVASVGQLAGVRGGTNQALVDHASGSEANTPLSTRSEAPLLSGGAETDTSKPLLSDPTLRRILLSSPPCQFDEVLSSLRIVCSGRRHETAVLLDERFITSVRNEWDGKFTDTTPAPNTECEEARVAIRSKLDIQVISNFAEGTTSDVTFHPHPDPNKCNLKVSIVGRNIDRGNWLAATWREEWDIVVTLLASGEFGPTVEIKGNISLRSHSFEKGNIHLHYDKADEEFVPAKLAKIAIQILNRGELLARGLEEEMNIAGALKRLRRPLPVTQMKMDW